MELAKFAVAGLMGSALALTACGGPKAAPAHQEPTTTAAATAGDGGGMAGHDMSKTAMADGAASHDCAAKGNCSGMADAKGMGDKASCKGMADAKGMGDKASCKGMADAKGMGADKAAAGGAPPDMSKSMAADGDKTYSELHDCAGKNSCKGLGGCKVTSKDPAASHDCKGMNSCKGLGGCKVDAERLAMLKAKMSGAGAAK